MRREYRSWGAGQRKMYPQNRVQRVSLCLNFAAGWAESKSVKGGLRFEAGDSDESKPYLVWFTALPLYSELDEVVLRGSGYLRRVQPMQWRHFFQSNVHLWSFTTYDV